MKMKFRDNFLNILHKFDKISFFILKNLNYFHANKLLIFFMKDSIVLEHLGPTHTTLLRVQKSKKIKIR